MALFPFVLALLAFLPTSLTRTVPDLHLHLKPSPQPILHVSEQTSCESCLEPLSSTQFCKSKGENGLRVDLRYVNKKKHLLDIFSNGKVNDSDRRLMRLKFDNLTKECQCRRLLDPSFNKSKLGPDVYVVFSTALKLAEPSAAKKLVEDTLRYVFSKACPDEEKRIQAFYAAEGKLAAEKEAQVDEPENEGRPLQLLKTVKSESDSDDAGKSIVHKSMDVQ